MTSAVPEIAVPSPRRGQLAILVQELLTTTARLHAHPDQVPADVDAFRAQVRRNIEAASQEARRLGYDDADALYALYAVVAFLDETVMALGHPVFRPWQGKPLQEEVFGINIGGDAFFQYLEALLQREDSEDLADTLEVFQLCLLLGFRGRYGGAQAETLHVWISRIRDRLTRIRGLPPPLAPHWAPQQAEFRPAAGDPLQRRLLYALLTLSGVAVLLFLVFWWRLGAESSALQAITLR